MIGDSNLEVISALEMNDLDKFFIERMCQVDHQIWVYFRCEVTLKFSEIK